MYDYLIIGSGFGGSVSALRLTEKGYRVAMLEQGRRISAQEMKQAGEEPRALFWEPRLGLRGYFSQVIFKHMAVVRGIGVGGGSLVYAAVLLRPGEAFFRSAEWSQLADWSAELLPHYDLASRMLGISTNPKRGIMDDFLYETARKLKCEESFGSVPQGIYFAEENAQRPRSEGDPYFDGMGPNRNPCTFCGKCVSGCAEGAKNSLDKNYLYLAERNGLDLIAETRADKIIPVRSGFIVEGEKTDGSKERVRFHTRKLVLAAGVLGTLELLFRNRDEYGTLPAIGQQLGKRVRTNSEALVAAMSKNPELDLTFGTTISTDFYYGADTHITQNRLPPSHDVMRFYFGPMVDDPRPGKRALRTLLNYFKQPIVSTAAWRKHWYKRTTLLTVMQNQDNSLEFRFGRRWFMPWKRQLCSQPMAGKQAPTYLEKANQAARALAEVSGGIPQSIALESIGNKSLTAHILGGACIGATEAEGVVDSHHRMFAYPDIYIADASAIPANIGVNPSLTITAMAERMASLMR